MFSEKPVNELIEKIKRFEENIPIPSDYDETLYERAIIKNPKLIFYVESLQIKKGISPTFQVTTKLQIKYHNKDMNLSDIYSISTVADIFSLICRYVGNYKPTLGVIIDTEIDVSKTFDEFVEKYGVAYPNYIGATISGFTYNNRSAYKFTFRYRIGKVKLNMMENEVRAEVERVSKLLFDASMPPEAKIYLAHNYLATSVDYYGADTVSTLERSYVQSAYGALITKKCVCQGIAEAFKRLMDRANVACDVVCGKIIGHEDYHAWNIVELSDSDCYHVDVTWDISARKPSFLYFGKNDLFLAKTREWNKDNYAKCQAKNNLFMLAKKYITANKKELLGKGISTKILGL